jgi:peptidoglycan/xylan/chitin deacetylase (PgdA/CDA1 family)
MLRKIINKIKQRLIHWRIRPIRIFCLHHVCEKFDIDSMYLCDWLSVNDFKKKIENLRNDGYQFISLTEAHNHLKNNFFRNKKYAVITFDDGYKSLLEIIPWLISERIPTTLFINGKYLDGVSFRNNANEKYLDYPTLFNLTDPLIEVGHHGWEHNAIDSTSTEGLEESIKLNVNILSSHPRYIPYWAYTYGRKSNASDQILKDYQLIPVMVSGCKNINDRLIIDREAVISYDKEKIALKMCRNKDVCKQCFYNL